MVSIIIPALNEAATISRTLSALMKVKGDLEVIVVDGGSDDNTRQLVSSFEKVQFVTAKKGRSHQMNKGAKLASGSTLLFLHADTYLPDNSIAEISAILDDRNYIAGSFYLKFDKKHWLLSLYTACSKINSSFFTYGDHGIFIKKSSFQRIGGYKPIPLMEDVEIQSRLRKSGKFKKLSLGVVTSARRFMKTGIVKQFTADIILVLLYKAGIPPFQLKKYYKDRIS